MIGDAGIASTRGLSTTYLASSRILVLAALLGTAPAFAQSTWRIIPSISIAETLTDNVRLAPDSQKDSDVITQISPGVQVEGTTGRLRLNFNYRATGLLYAKNSDSNDIQNYFDGSGTFEAVRNWLFVDARASVTQQSFSAFGSQGSIAPENINSNRAETLAYQISPYVRGRFTPNIDYNLRYTLTGTKVQGNNVGDSQVEDWLGTITGPPIARGLEWSGTAQYTIAHPGEGRDVSSQRAFGSLGYRFGPQIRTSLRAGWESNDYASTNNDSGVYYGAELQWVPTDRTQIHALTEHRPFTNTHTFTFQHRTRLTSWQLSDSKSVTTGPAQLALARLGTAFDLLFNVLATSIPDPVARTAEVNRQLQQSGIPRDLQLATTFVTSRVIVQRARQASVAILGVRNTVTLGASLVESRSIDTGAPFVDDFSTTSEIEQKSFIASWAHQLSAITTANLIGTYVRSTGASGSGPETTEKSARFLLNHQFSPKTTGSVGLRYIRFDSSTAEDFREKAVTASVLVTFY
jgi:uncharacterized protein (PEP-CTERM system associated)